MRNSILALSAAAVLAASTAFAANVPLLPSTATIAEPSQQIPTINGVIQSINANITPQTMGTFSNFRNLLDNGAIQVQQRGTGIQTCAANAGTVAANYAADRWSCSANVAVGAGRMQVITATPAPPQGFAQSQKLFRTSGALTQPVCAIQVLPTVDAIALQGQPTTLSFYAQALAGLGADNGNVISANIFTGTGTNEGLGTMTASPAITPAWTGIATTGTANFTITTSWNRYTLPNVVIPAATTEIAVALCFTPTATGAGTTDGFAFVGVQYEQGTAASAYEYKPGAIEVTRAQRFYYEIDESATIGVFANCRAHSVTVQECYVQFPVTMFKAPTMTYTAGFATETTAAGGTLGNCSALATATTVASTAPVTNGILVGCTATTVPAAGVAGFLFGNGGSGKVIASADF